MEKNFPSSHKVVNFLFVALFFTIILSNYASASELSDAVVKIYVTSNSIDYYRPWQSLGSEVMTGTGCIIDNKRILTNAHVINDYTFIQVKKNGDPKRYTARVIATGDDCDLALLTVDEPGFFEDISPFKLGKLPNLQDTVTVLGYPEGGDKLSITEGVISRIEVTAYAQSGRSLLTVQIDAAINPGNSGGPVVENNKLVGIAMQIFNTGQNIGYMIPTPIIEHFFADFADGTFNGFPLLGIEFDNTENPFLKEFYGIKQYQGGVLVNKILPLSPVYGLLYEGDVILEIDNTPIGEDGTFSFRKNERLSLNYLITQKQIGENIKLKVVRNQNVETITISLKPFEPLVPYPRYYQKPPYFIFGGLVFTALSTDLLKSWGTNWWEKAPIDFTYYLIGAGRINKEKRNELVVLLTVLSDEINVGYQHYENDIIKSVNGKEFASFKEFIEIIKNINDKEKYTIFQTENDSLIILPNLNIKETTAKIIERNNIPFPYSPDVRSWLSPE